jgi:hypothetical protein
MIADTRNAESMNLPDLHGLCRRRWWRADRCLCGVMWPCSYLVRWALDAPPAPTCQPMYGLGMPANAWSIRSRID